MKTFFLLCCLLGVSYGLPQWPYRGGALTGGEYYGYQRGFQVSSVEGQDDEDDNSSFRQDLKVATGEQPITNTAAAPAAPVVVETGSAKPVSVDTKASNAATVQQPSENAANVKAPSGGPPAFPPATTPPPAPPAEEDSEEDSEEDDEEDEENDDDDGSDEDDGRSDLKDVAMGTKKTNETVQSNSTVVRQTVEALVPGYVTEQGEVLVPFDTVAKETDVGVVALVEDPTSSTGYQNKPPVIVLPSDSEQDNKVAVPKFFKQTNKQLYYSDVPPPGAIFTFDDEENNEVPVARGRRDSSEEDLNDDDDSGSEEEDEVSPRKPPLSFAKATAPSGEDDEAESLGLLRRRSAWGGDNGRSPNLFYAGDGFYYARFADNQREREVSPPRVYYYRPTSTEKVRVVPIGSFDLSLEESVESGEVRPVVRQSPQSIVPTPQRMTLYNFPRGTLVTRQRSTVNKKQRREAKELKKQKKMKTKKVVAVDQLGLLKKVKKNGNKKN